MYCSLLKEMWYSPIEIYNNEIWYFAKVSNMGLLNLSQSVLVHFWDNYEQGPKAPLLFKPRTSQRFNGIVYNTANNQSRMLFSEVKYTKKT
jgi:hypothetical protein